MIFDFARIRTVVEDIEPGERHRGRRALPRRGDVELVALVERRLEVRGRAPRSFEPNRNRARTRFFLVWIVFLGLARKNVRGAMVSICGARPGAPGAPC